MDSPNFKPTLFERLGVRAFHLINSYIPWHRLPGLIGAFNLDFMRVELRNYNLHDGYANTEAQGKLGELPATEQRYVGTRNSDGSDNSLEMRKMGCTGMRFGRNFARKHCHKPTEEELWNPSPRLVSQTFMARKPEDFKPATTLNLLAAAWIQFQVHDWFNHEDSDQTYNIPLQKGDDWPAEHKPMRLFKTKPDEVQDASDERCPGYRNMNTAWWDGSQIYGSSESVTQSLRGCRTDGKLVLDSVGKEPHYLPRSPDGTPKTGFTDNWWLGVEMLHTLFALEHNAICDEIKQGHPRWTGDQIFDKARIVNCALMAKIHTVEWTPAILAHPALQIGMSANWWGIVGEKLTKAVGRISKTSEATSGIPGSGVDHHCIPYSLTEEFVSVYRMHSLIPDNIALFGAESGRHIGTVPTEDVTFTKSLDPFKAGVTFADAFYSFGINYPGAITNSNYPVFMQRLTTPDGQLRDMGTVDILRDRERGVPRYTEFRRLLRMTVPKTFEELTGGNKELAAKLSEVYGGDIDKVDALIGSHSEPLPEGFGFSDTAFRIFILMASRRLKSDRFIAGSWNAAMYTKEGFDWVQNSSLSDVLRRHFPELKAVLPEKTNVFAPWVKLPGSQEYAGIETNAPKS
ncbi:Alpha-dioxygenase 2 [Fulvia fulva]|nr:Alpha-dioxygenase 2 [Fulvia fulva]KAK4614399.1 Alpha-dioxygenase 2 [Fulvia fulva]WPV20071.1 Alpha-dioxygenase 2 [Fulvia fulva]WPV34863.1 Alpha-dioxygenase 2 [Fulvia fulva]